ncbi:MAG: hypothetical protein HC893_16540, partial [Chloroflexaceae bacterium]|nr:hypothetical protein [Chloroflexaceae bacterium]
QFSLTNLFTSLIGDSRPTVASDGSDFLAVWHRENRTNNTNRLVARRFDRNGNVAGPLYELSDDVPLGLLQPELIWLGDRYRVVWAGGGGESVGPTSALMVHRSGRVCW